MHIISMQILIDILIYRFSLYIKIKMQNLRKMQNNLLKLCLLEVL